MQINRTFVIRSVLALVGSLAALGLIHQGLPSTPSITASISQGQMCSWEDKNTSIAMELGFSPVPGYIPRTKALKATPASPERLPMDMTIWEEKYVAVMSPASFFLPTPATPAFVDAMDALPVGAIFPMTEATYLTVFMGLSLPFANTIVATPVPNEAATQIVTPAMARFVYTTKADIPQLLLAAPVPATTPIAERVAQFLLGTFLFSRVMLVILICLLFFVGSPKANDTNIIIKVSEHAAAILEAIDASATLEVAAAAKEETTEIAERSGSSSSLPRARKVSLARKMSASFEEAVKNIKAHVSRPRAEAGAAPVEKKNIFSLGKSMSFRFGKKTAPLAA